MMTHEEISLKAYKDLRGFWNTTAIASDKSIVLGRGATQDQATDEAYKQLIEYESFLALPPAKQLKVLVSQERILDTDKERCIRLLAELVLRLIERVS
jgi:hypothetical protein